MSGYSVLGGLRCCGWNWVDIGEESRPRASVVTAGPLVCISPYSWSRVCAKEKQDMECCDFGLVLSMCEGETRDEM